MTMTDMRRPALRNDLYIRSEELTGTPADQMTEGQTVESDADELVRQLLLEEKRRTIPERLPQIAPQEEVLTYDPVSPEDRKQSAQQSIAQILKAERAPTARPTGAGRARPRLPALSLPQLRMPQMRRMTARSAKNTGVAPTASGAIHRRLRLPRWLRSYRPTRKHVAWAVVAGLVLYRPLMVPLVALLLVWLVLIAYLTLGPDRWGEILGGAWQRLHARKPELAERIRQRADRFAERFDRVLDRLPEAWADRLALPDFSASATTDAEKPDPFDRLAAEARET
ncbi:hypothetical protein FIU85_15510 [Roseovarius sp. THAF8]|uniref:hypothetical protein n=1 Tax=Roseovarius sp. THAF8 TaxID=2587846 RepID=UPI0012695C76|nr:hypothetical protein [Roseovarius sp. THAF8]QFT98720.1 hypothetical protein FIU85_15510 [Roseovarius sp. THAF8]